MLVPEHAPPDQPTNSDPLPAVAVSVTDEPSANCAEHVDPQSIPTGLEVTVPDPVPAVDTVSVHSTPVPAGPLEPGELARANVAAAATTTTSTAPVTTKRVPLCRVTTCRP